jgi:hypothetical protein
MVVIANQLGVYIGIAIIILLQYWSSIKDSEFNFHMHLVLLPNTQDLLLQLQGRDLTLQELGWLNVPESGIEMLLSLSERRKMLMSNII